jgi:AraC family transcriptional activator of mtrCDE
MVLPLQLVTGGVRRSPHLVPTRPIIQQATLPMHLERLLDNLALDVEAFALCRVASGWRLRLPALDWVTFHFVVRGRGEARGGSECRTLAPGSVVLVPPKQVHSIQSGPPPHAERGLGGSRSWAGLPEHLAGPEDDANMLVVCGRAQVLYGGVVGVFDQLHEILAMDFADEPRVSRLFETMLGEVQSPRPGSRAMISALMDEFLVHAFRRLSVASGDPIPWLDVLEASALRPAVGAMLERPEDPHTVATLAELCFMSRSTFARRFKESFGHPPMEYLRGIRLRHAARLLRQRPRPAVAVVAKRVGFESRSQFSRAFKELFHAAPSEYEARVVPGGDSATSLARESVR